jgi:hypothetical protein
MFPTLAMQAWNEDRDGSWRPATVIAPPWRAKHASVPSTPGWLVSGELDTPPYHERVRRHGPGRMLPRMYLTSHCTDVPTSPQIPLEPHSSAEHR